ncbi:MAG: hypothetical protein Ta2A_22490 [Treponemataceae bacterium]|nr:MAG: hypothetical protein Ta2A_22490 [Treponemataceae bacterium]
MHPKEIPVLTILFVSLLILCAASFLPFFTFSGGANTKIGVKTVHSALLNKKYHAQLARIVISYPTPKYAPHEASEPFVLERDLEQEKSNAQNSGIWFIPVGDTKYPAVQNTVARFIENAESVREMEEISRNDRNFADFGLSEDNAIIVKFESMRQNGERTVFSQIFFGAHDVTGNLVNVRSTNIAYRITDDFSAFLPQADHGDFTAILIGGFADLSLINTSINSDGIKRAVLTDFQTGNTAVLDATLHETLLALRAVGVLDETQLAGKTPEKTDADAQKHILRIEFDDASIRTYSVFPEAFVTDSGYALKISAWTHKTLCDIFYGNDD